MSCSQSCCNCRIAVFLLIAPKAHINHENVSEPLSALLLIFNEIHHSFAVVSSVEELSWAIHEVFLQHAVDQWRYEERRFTGNCVVDEGNFEAEFNLIIFKEQTFNYSYSTSSMLRTTSQSLASNPQSSTTLFH